MMSHQLKLRLVWVILIIGFTGCGPAVVHQPGIDTVALFGDGTFQIVHGYNFGPSDAREKVYELYRLPQGELLVADVKKWRKHRGNVYLFAHDGRGRGQFFIVDLEANKVRDFESIRAAPEEHWPQLERLDRQRDRG
jgi:hypothetical protein